MEKNSFSQHILYLFIAVECIGGLGSCTAPKNVIYFQNLQKDTNLPVLVDNNFELKIRKSDLLYISIASPDPLSTPVFNAPQGSLTSSGTQGGGTAAINGYQVDNNGNITIYKIGAIHAEGLTRNELKLKLQKELSPYLKDVLVTIRFLSNHITMLGEVSKPQVITMADEKISVLEAIGMSGDLTITGRRDNVLVIRETPTGKQFKRLNLTDNSIFTSPFYYLKPDDVVYVEPTSLKIKNSGNGPQTIGYLLTGLSIAITLLLNVFHK